MISPVQNTIIANNYFKGTYCYTINTKSMNWESSKTRVYNGMNYQSKHNLKSYQKVDTKSSAGCHSKNIIHYPIMVVEGLAKSYMTGMLLDGVVRRRLRYETEFQRKN